MNFWESEFDNVISKKNKTQDFKPNQIKLEVQDTFKKDEKITTNFDPQKNEDVINKAYLGIQLSKMQAQISIIEKNYNDYKLHNKEDLLLERAVRPTIQTLYDKGLFDKHDNGDQVLKQHLLVEFNDRRRPELEVVIDVIQGFCS